MAGEAYLVDGPPGQSLSFVVPGTPRMSVLSVLAEIDASGAGDTTATLEIRDRSGDVLDALPQGQAVSGGGQGRATWALRLAEDAAAAPPVTPATFVTAHVTGGLIPVPSNNSQMPLTIDAAQGVVAGVNSWTIQTAGWYLCFGAGGFTRRGPSVPRERIGWLLHRTGSTHGVGANTDAQDALLAGEFLTYNMSACVPMFVPAGDTFTLFASADSSSGTLDFDARVGVWKIA